MDAQKNAAGFDDEEIIDLTDIIEKGVKKEPTDDALAPQLSDLSASGSGDASSMDMDADIDALLSQMSGESGAGDVDATSSTTAPAPQKHVVNPDETLDMPGMAEVDSLLQELDMPPQPKAAAPAASPPPDVPADELDSLLDGLLDGSAQAGSTADGAPQTASSTTPDLDGLDDLDALLGNAPAQAAAPPAEPTPAAATTPDLDGLDDLDALLGNAPAQAAAPPAEPTPAAAPAATPAETTTLDDLDALLADASQGSAGSGAGSSADLDDLDALLGTATVSAAPASQGAPLPEPLPEGAGAAAEAPSASPKAAPIAAGQEVALDDLDALLGGDAATESAPAAEPAQPAAYPAEPLNVADLDSLLGQKIITTNPAAGYVPDVAELDNLDALLAASPAQNPEPGPDTLHMLKNFDDTPLPAQTAAEGVPTLTEDLMALDALLSTSPAEEAPTEAAPSAPEAAAPPAAPASENLLSDLDSLLGDAAQADSPGAADAATAESWRAPLPELLTETPAAEAEGEDPLAQMDPQELNRAAQSLLDEKVMLEASIDDVDTGAWMNSLDEALAEEPLPAGSPAESAPQPEAPVLPLATAATLGATAASAPAGDASAEMSEEDRARISELEERLMALEEQWQVRESTHRQMIEHMNTQDLHHSERLSALEARLGSVQAEAHAETQTRLGQLEERLDARDAQAPQPQQDAPSGEEEALRAARLDLIEGRLMVLEEAEEKRTACETPPPPGDMDAEACAAAPQPADMPACEGSLEERISQMEQQTMQAQVELEERLSTLEAQCRQMENFIQERLENAAAAAAARIIREEIAALLVDHTTK